MNVAEVDLTGGVHIGAIRRLFDFSNADLGLECGPVRCYDVAPDGSRLYGIKAAAPLLPAPPVTHINLIQNWFEELKAKVPVK